MILSSIRITSSREAISPRCESAWPPLLRLGRDAVGADPVWSSAPAPAPVRWARRVLKNDDALRTSAVSLPRLRSCGVDLLPDRGLDPGQRVEGGLGRRRRRLEPARSQSIRRPRWPPWWARRPSPAAARRQRRSRSRAARTSPCARRHQRRAADCARTGGSQRLARMLTRIVGSLSSVGSSRG